MEDIKQWLTSEMNYQEGVAIFEKYCKNKIFVRNFKNGSPKYMQAKLEYEMKRLLGIPLSAITSQTCSNQQLVSQLPVTSYKVTFAAPPLRPATSSQSIQSLPNQITKAKELRNELYTQIANIHKDLYELGEGNTEKIIKQRKILLDKRKPLIEKHENIYRAIEEYFITKIVPDNLQALLSEVAIPESSNHIDFEKLPDIQLVKLKNKIATQITKIKNLLNFQSYTSQKEPNPMPEGSKRKETEKRLQELTDNHTQISKIIKSRE
jgi:hypothetical protein